MSDIKLRKSFQYLKIAEERIPALTQTFSKSAFTFVKGAYPVYVDHAKGCHMFDVDRNEFIDYLCGLGPIILGYQYPSVDKAILKQLKNGILFSLPHKLELDLAELICKTVPSAEMVKYSKTGSDAVTFAVRGARAITKRDKIAYCGSMGVQHDWQTILTTRDKGIPKWNRKQIYTFEYNKIETLEKILEKDGKNIAAVCMEPTIFEPPKKDFLKKAKKLTHEYGAVLIFDEIVTGFRFAVGGGQEKYGVKPDITCLGKGMANGMPLGAVTGKKEYMKIFDDVFFSSTNQGETLSLAASIATIEEVRQKNVPKYLWNIGSKLMNGYNKISKESDVGVSFIGYPIRMRHICIDSKGKDSLEVKSLMLQEMVKRGIFLHPAGSYISFSHKEEDINKTLDAFRETMMVVKKAVKNNTVKEQIKGEIIKPVFPPKKTR
ncbi:MAG TPA: aminotransferase class III-fold pyridoxal phosphate-dependent enzyme [Verrucomicrobiae bacterium]|nr:aminotransferase class III-fold pyridoxal phosphate-dependent enzyme [Verrucomicrobiae bacterium]